ncbi:hypothetical protein [Anoxybacillus sp. J5B_2022]|uniref:hypothetical protein n=1 Tax=Anoxybacillus sp. J5B_2022 TaxID=3003246 RepID=UPI002285AD7B|nr:hypothetical protein [Anoxybacillus sp. J5B_2022]MCZ0755327.1 hypothetical protein [Anoxybacillus sp. J5B_2022]
MIQRVSGSTEQRWPTSASSVPLQNGQVVYGKVEKIGANGMAFVRIGGEMIEAELQTPLQAGQFYSFQVTKEEETILLKRLDAPSERSEATIEQIAEQLVKKWRLSREMQSLLRFLLQKQVPFAKADIVQAEKWLLATPERDINLRALEMMYANRLPVTESVFFALKAVQHPESLATQLSDLQRALASIPKQQLSEAQQTLLGELERMNRLLVDDQQEQRLDQLPKTFAKHMKALIKALGLEYEANVAKDVQTARAMEGLKPLLLRAQQERSDETLTKQVDTLIHRLTGQQLLSHEQGPIQPLFIQLPFLFGNERTDVTIHWQTRKKQNGEIDPHYCRLLFYLQLPALKEITVDVRIQNSIIHVSLFNDTPQLETIVSLMQPMLKERLSACGYTLSTVKVATPPEQKQSDVLFLRVLNNYSGVDYRI